MCVPIPPHRLVSTEFTPEFEHQYHLLEPFPRRYRSRTTDLASFQTGSVPASHVGRLTGRRSFLTVVVDIVVLILGSHVDDARAPAFV
jgi:hypothetical protein